ncbi:peroxide stress protein YaaA [Gryllotalpicola sp.]|uniref:YaaA family protein n=1 Tax=Gryllotalpicola sp. TaxID=1932787 RepID=UPI0026044474|nr:peroxide stress protein YaaA [Gryllotalpicola sp.]
MLLLLPPSETKRPGGGGGLRLASLRFPELADARRAVLRATRELAADGDAAVAALKLGRTRYAEVAKNRVLETSGVLPAADRYIGVLYGALDAATLPDSARARLGRHVVIQSALFGPVGALDGIPDYRLSHDSRLPGLRLKEVWAQPVAAVLASRRGLIVDARSRSYAELGPIPDRDDAVVLDVVSEDAASRRRALNHFNKHAKGELARAFALAGVDPQTPAEFVEWGDSAGFRLELDGRRLTLVTH